MHPLVGTYTLVSMKHAPQGEKAYDPYGIHPQGLLIYTPERMLVTLISEDGRKSFFYGGRCRVEGARVIHEVEVSSKLEWVGSRQEREVSFDRDHVTFRTTFKNPATGMAETAALCWRRIETF